MIHINSAFFFQFAVTALGQAYFFYCLSIVPCSWQPSRYRTKQPASVSSEEKQELPEQSNLVRNTDAAGSSEGL